jgi:hypothetical protein
MKYISLFAPALIVAGWAFKQNAEMLKPES